METALVSRKKMVFRVISIVLAVGGPFLIAYGISRFSSIPLPPATPRDIKIDPDIEAQEKKFYSKLPKDEVDELTLEASNILLLFDPETLIKEAPENAIYFDISKNGYRVIENQAPWPPPKGEVNVFVLGGSTTFGYFVVNSDTIPSYLQEKLRNDYPNRKINVYNFGRGFYDSALEYLLFKKLMKNGTIPNIAVFIDGTNDTYNGSDVLPLYAAWFFDTNMPSTNIQSNLSDQEIIERALNIFKELNLQIPTKIYTQADASTTEHFDRPLNPQGVIQKWLRYKQKITDLANQHNVKTFWVWQPSPAYKYDLAYDSYTLGSKTERAAKVYPLVEAQIKNWENTLWLGAMQENLKEPLYVDSVHYSPPMNKMIAEKIADYLESNRVIK